MYLIAEWRTVRLDGFLSSCPQGGNCLRNSSKHSLRCARRFFSSLLWTSLVPALEAKQIPVKLLWDNVTHRDGAWDRYAFKKEQIALAWDGNS